MKLTIAAPALVAFLATAAQGSIVSTAFDAFQISPPPFASLGSINIPLGGIAWNERQAVTLSNVQVDQLGNGTYGSGTGGVISGTFDSHLVHFDILTTGPLGGVATGTITFSGNIAGVCILQNTLDATDLLAGSPSTVYPTSIPGRDSGIALGGYVIVSGSTLSYQILVGTGEYQHLRVFTATPSPSSLAIGLLAAGVASRRRRVP